MQVVTFRVTLPQFELLECWAEMDRSISAVLRDLIAEKAAHLDAEHDRAKLSQPAISRAA